MASIPRSVLELVTSIPPLDEFLFAWSTVSELTSLRGIGEYSTECGLPLGGGRTTTVKGLTRVSLGPDRVVGSSPG